MLKCMLIPLYGDQNNYNVHSVLPCIPRVGEHIEMDDPHKPDAAIVFRVVAVVFSNSKSVDCVDVYLRPAGPLHDMIRRWSSL